MELITFKEFVDNTILDSDIEKEKKKFFSKNVNIPRKEMPQIRSIHFKEFENWLKSQNIKYSKNNIPAQQLYATQTNIKPEIVKDMLENPYKRNDIRPVLISKENYVLDGHHRVFVKRIQKEKIPVLKIEMPIKDLLDALQEFPAVQYYNESIELLEYEELILEETNLLLKGDKEIRNFEKTRHKMSKEEQEEKLTAIFNRIFPSIQKRFEDFKNIITGVSKKYKNTEFKFRAKTLESILDKTIGRGKQFSNLADLMGGMIITQDDENVENIANDLKRKFGNDVVKIEKKEKDGNRSGYFGAIHVDFDVDGLLGEIQILTKNLAKKKNLAHKIYTQVRTTGASEKELDMMRRLFVQGNLKEEFTTFEEFYSFYEDIYLR